MDFSKVEAIARAGFKGYMPSVYLRKSNCEYVPEEPGVYLILRLDRSQPDFLVQSVGGHFKGNDPTVGVDILEQEWVGGAIVVYIGSTGGEGKEANLKKRLTQLIQFGAGMKAGHHGGRYLWQLADAEQLIVCWKIIHDKEPSDVKSELLAEFKGQYGKRPFANLVG